MTTNDLGAIAIVRGNFAGEGSKGNYNAYNSKNKRFFISKAVMEALGYKKDADVKFPLYALATEEEYNVLDDAGLPTDEKFTRAQATLVCKTVEELTTLATSDESLNASIATSVGKMKIDQGVALSEYASTKGIKLTPAMVESFANASI